MSAIKLLLVILASCVALIFANNDAIEFANSNLKFTNDIYGHLILENGINGNNFVASPTSAHIILTLTNEGARDTTAKELSKALSLPNAPTYRNVIHNLHYDISTSILSLKMANKLYIAEHFKILPAYSSLAVDTYRADIENINFSNSEAAANTINKWVSDATNDTIKNLISSDQLSNLTKFVLINTLYFKGNWTVPFNAALTRDETFYPSCGGCEKGKIVKMMNAENNYLFLDSKELKAKFLEMSYKESNISMTFILPNERDGYLNVEKDIEKYLKRQKLETERVAVSIPKFKINSSIDFKKILKKLGVQDLFEPSANLSGISTIKDLYVQYVIQKAFIAVAEAGTEAAAATAVGGSTTVVTQPPKLNFKADHPFLYYIRDNTSGLILFIGRYIN